MRRITAASPLASVLLTATCFRQHEPEAANKRNGGTRLTAPEFLLKPIAHVESPLVARESAPKQGHEGSPEAWLVFDAKVERGARDFTVGDQMLVLTWFHLADRTVLATHPRDDLGRPELGVFSTRSPDRPNPIGLHRVTILAIDGLKVRVSDLEAVNGTPVIDVKPVLDARER